MLSLRSGVRRRKTIAFPGIADAYSEQAARKFAGPRAKTIPCATFGDVFRSVKRGKAGLGTVPIENSIAGSVHRNYDLLLKHGLHIVGEYHLPVHHCLLALPGTTRRQIRTVYSHPQALAQCEDYLTRLNGGVKEVAKEDTAASAEYVSAEQDRTEAAIASRPAARTYGLKVLDTNIEDDPANYTRFLFVARRPAKPRRPAKTSIVFALKDMPGALFKALSVFALRDIDLIKIESRPLVGSPWQYLFYVDFRGAADDTACAKALDHLSEYAAMLRVLGSYPTDRTRD